MATKSTPKSDYYRLKKTQPADASNPKFEKQPKTSLDLNLVKQAFSSSIKQEKFN